MLISVSDIIKKSIDIYRDHFLLFFHYIALLSITILISILSSLPRLVFAEQASQSISLAFFLFILPAIVTILISFFSIWIGISMIRVIAKICKSQEVLSLKRELLDVKSVIIPSIIASILVTVAIIFGVILFLIPGIIFSVWFAFSIHEIAIDKKKAIESIISSKDLVSGRFFAVLWRLLAPALLFVFVIFLFQSMIVAISYSLSMPKEIIALVQVISSFLGLFVAPLSYTAAVILYLELKKTPLRKEV